MLVKTEGSIIIAIFVLILLYLYLDKKIRKEKIFFGYAVAGMLVPLVFMMLYFYLFTGDPIFNLHTYSVGLAGLSKTTLSKNLNILDVVLDPLYLLHAQIYPSLDPSQYPLGFIILFAIVGSILAFARKNKVLVAFSIIVIIFLLYLFFGTKSMYSYILITVVSRYVISVAAPIAILASYSLYELYNAVKKESKAAASIAIILLISFSTLANVLSYRSIYSYNLGVRSYNIIYPMLIHDIITANASKVYTSSMIQGLDIQYLSFLSGYRGISFLMPGPHCNATLYNSLLLTSFNNFAAEKNSAELMNWSGNNCYLEPVASYNVSTSKNTFTKGELFKILPKT